jgi:Predicted Zn-dependent protease (DUF2268)
MKSLSLMMTILAGISMTDVAHALNLVDSHDAVQDFLDATVDTPASEWMKAFEELESKYPEFYQNIAFRKGREGWEERRTKLLEHFFATLPSTRDRIRKLNDEQKILVERAAKNFKTFLPDARLDVDVYFLPGFTFNGKVDKVMPEATSESLFVAIDRVVEWESDVAVLMAHELFHVHHFEQPAPKGRTLTTGLWTEGLATFASGVLTETLDTETLFMDAKLADACNKPDVVAQWSREFNEVADMQETDPGADQVYAQWFLGNGGAEIARRGYCVGYAVAKELWSQGVTLAEMVSWGGETYERRIHAILDGQSQPHRN